jgi:hypothetical protein
MRFWKQLAVGLAQVVEIHPADFLAEILCSAGGGAKALRRSILSQSRQGVARNWQD